MSNYTPEDLILYLYGEADPAMTSAIERTLEGNWALREKLTVLKASMTSLNRLDAGKLLSPANSTLKAIMAYATEQSKIHH